MKNTLGYDFFVVEKGAPFELDPAFGDKFASHFNLKVASLAYDIAQLLKQIEPAVPAIDVVSPSLPPNRQSTLQSAAMTGASRGNGSLLI
jgi:hypothetical protein